MIHKSLWHSLSLWLEAQLLLEELLASQLLSATIINIRPGILSRFLSRFLAIECKSRAAGGCQIVENWYIQGREQFEAVTKLLDTTMMGKSFSSHFSFSYRFTAVSLLWKKERNSIILSFLPHSKFILSFYPFIFTTQLTNSPLVEILLVLVRRYQLCIPASWCTYDLEIFHVANQKMPLTSVSHLPESTSYFLALHIYHFIRSKSLHKHLLTNSNKNHPSPSPYPVTV